MIMIRHLLYGCLGLLLLPVATGLTRTLFFLLVESQMDPATGQTVMGFSAGAGVWVAVFLLLPRPVRGYVLAHELSHAIAAWLSGGRVSRLRVGREGGSVQVSRVNLFVALAPYMIPFYSLLLLLGVAVAGLWVDLTPWHAALPPLLGATWSFHLTFTIASLALGQTDIHPYGPVGAYPVIYIGNLLFLLPALVWLAPVSLETALRTGGGHVAGDVLKVWGWIQPLFA